MAVIRGGMIPRKGRLLVFVLNGDDRVARAKLAQRQGYAFAILDADPVEPLMIVSGSGLFARLLMNDQGCYRAVGAA